MAIQQQDDPLISGLLFFGGVGAPATTCLSDVVYTESESAWKMGEKTQLAHWGAIKFQSPG